MSKAHSNAEALKPDHAVQQVGPGQDEKNSQPKTDHQTGRQHESDKDALACASILLGRQREGGFTQLHETSGEHSGHEKGR